MSTPKTPMERASTWCWDNGYIRKTVTIEGEWTEPLPGCEKAYLAGDADRKRIENEKRELSTVGVDQFYLQKYKDAISAARADRAELVACVLDLAQITESVKGKSVIFRAYDILDKYIGKHADLIAKLKAEKDAV